MNIIDIKNEIISKKGRKVRVSIFGLRNRKDIMVGVLDEVYPNIFTVKSKEMSKSFSYSDVLIGDVKIEYI